MNAYTEHFIYACLRFLILGQQLLHFSQTNPEDFIENFGYTSLMF